MPTIKIEVTDGHDIAVMTKKRGSDEAITLTTLSHGADPMVITIPIDHEVLVQSLEPSPIDRNCC